MSANGLRQKYPMRTKGSSRIPSTLIRPLFDLETPQTFLLRSLEPLERSVVKQWCAYCRKKLDRHSGPVSLLGRDFIKEIVNRGYEGGLLNGHSSKLLFQNLFVHVPSLNPVAAIMRISGNNIRPTETERKLAFREIVQIHREQFGELNFPTWNNIDEYHDRRYFLSHTGIIVPSSYVFRQFGKNKEKDKSVEAFVRELFEIPEEIPEDILKQAFSENVLTEKDFVDNYRCVYEWMRTINPTIDRRVVPSRVDIEAFYQSGAINAISAARYDTWLHTNSNMNTHLPKRSYDWLRDQLEIGGSPKRATRRSNVGRNHWTPKRIIHTYLALWQFENPEGINFAAKYFADPPTRTRMEIIGKHQTSIINQYGQLIPSECEKIGIPTFLVPAPDTVQKRYPGGFMKMLRDIEVEFGMGKHIVFSNKIQLSKMHTLAINNGSDLRDIPLAVARYRVAGR